MEKKNYGQQLPDFDELNDRVIAESSPFPTLVIETNLDAKNSAEENPYFNPNASKGEKQKLEQFFD